MLQTVIMAAGKSTRTYPLTLTKPKPLLRIANKPILAHQLDLFLGLIDEAILIVGYKHEMIREEFGESYRGIALRYVEQREQLGTGHAAMQVEPYIKDRFVLMNGDDLYAKEDLGALLNYRYALLAQEVENPHLYGVLTVQDGLVKDVVEKPEHPLSNLTSVGMYLFDRGIFEMLKQIPRSPRGEYEVTDAVKQLARTEELHYHVSPGLWMPVGFPWSVLTANDFLLQRRPPQGIEGTIEPHVNITGNLSLGAGSVIRSGTHIQGNLCVGENTIIGPNCHIRGNTSIGDHCMITGSNSLINSVIGAHVRVAPFCQISHTVIGDGVLVHSGLVTMSEPMETPTVTSVIKGIPVNSAREQFGAVFASGVIVQPHVVTFPGVKVAPETLITAGTVVKEDL
ncbi:nucleotidyl transferase [Candidatus Moduliflexus flocculans]|uniref:Nucleotidyl transferase n=1 Tax=Candidatus Moduliflexus flocculans TaxID=1499966 RepID=A0A081BNZ4_9BACT|nr:nucleotidyl transferase [Candidatus Moduliflexus flocculans]